MTAASVGVVVAMPAEARTLGLRAGVGHCCAHNDAWVAVAGIGPERAAVAAQRLLDAGATALLSWGVAGGIAPDLRAGALLVARAIRNADDEALAIDSRWQARMRAGLAVAHGPVAEGPLLSQVAPLSSAADKRAHAARGMLGVDMESAAVARIAQRAGVPFIAVKAICDSAERDVPAAVAQLLDARARLRPAAALRVVASGPRVWRQLATLRGDYACARRSLAAAAATALGILPA